MNKNGHCLCKKIQFTYSGTEKWSGHCHCESCRRQTASPFTTFVGIDNAQWRWVGATPSVYESSAGVRRYFCDQCGSPIAYESDKWSGEIHFYVSLLTEHGDFKAEKHFHRDEQVKWVALADECDTKC